MDINIVQHITESPEDEFINVELTYANLNASPAGFGGLPPPHDAVQVMDDVPATSHEHLASLQLAAPSNNTHF